MIFVTEFVNLCKTSPFYDESLTLLEFFYNSVFWLSATRCIKVKRIGIKETLRSIWLISGNKIKPSQSICKQSSKLKIKLRLKSSLWQTIATMDITYLAKLIKQICKKIQEATGEKLSTFYHMHSISMAIQKGNAVCVRGCPPKIITRLKGPLLFSCSISRNTLW